jgi:hypothetical protein
MATELTEPAERALVRQLATVARGGARARRTAREPHRIPAFLVETAAEFHRFYHACRVVTDDEARSRHRLRLCGGHRRRCSATGSHCSAFSAPEAGSERPAEGGRVTAAAHPRRGLGGARHHPHAVGRRGERGARRLGELLLVLASHFARSRSWPSSARIFPEPHRQAVLRSAASISPGSRPQPGARSAARRVHGRAGHAHTLETQLNVFAEFIPS